MNTKILYTVIIFCIVGMNASALNVEVTNGDKPFAIIETNDQKYFDNSHVEKVNFYIQLQPETVGESNPSDEKVQYIYAFVKKSATSSAEATLSQLNNYATGGYLPFSNDWDIAQVIEPKITPVCNNPDLKVNNIGPCYKSTVMVGSSLDQSVNIDTTRFNGEYRLYIIVVEYGWGMVNWQLKTTLYSKDMYFYSSECPSGTISLMTDLNTDKRIEFIEKGYSNEICQEIGYKICSLPSDCERLGDLKMGINSSSYMDKGLSVYRCDRDTVSNPIQFANNNANKQKMFYGTCIKGAKTAYDCDAWLGSPSLLKMSFSGRFTTASLWGYTEEGTCVAGYCRSFYDCKNQYNTMFMDCVTEQLTPDPYNIIGVCKPATLTPDYISQMCDKTFNFTIPKGMKWDIKYLPDGTPDCSLVAAEITQSQCSTSTDCEKICSPSKYKVISCIANSEGGKNCMCGGLQTPVPPPLPSICGDNTCSNSEKTSGSCQIDCGVIIIRDGDDNTWLYVVIILLVLGLSSVVGYELLLKK